MGSRLNPININGVVPEPAKSHWPRLAVFCLLALLALVPVIALSAYRDFDHDENQFVASGAMLHREGLLPYRDYGYFHLPNQVFVDAWLFGLSDHLLLTARLFQALCGWLTVLTVAGVVYRIYGKVNPRRAGSAAVMAGIALLTTPLFTQTSGLAWNHDLSTLLALWAFLCVLLASQRKCVVTELVAGGMLLGLAIGTRLTFAPAGVALLVIISQFPRRSRIQRAGLMALFVVALLAALLPTFWLWLKAPGPFIFGNWIYPQLNTALHRANHYPRGMTFLGKLIFPFKDVLPRLGNIPLTVAFVVSLLAMIFAPRDHTHPRRFALRASLIMIAGLLVGTYAPTPLFVVYFYAPVPFAILFIALMAADVPARQQALRRWRRALVAMTFLAAAIAIVDVKPWWRLPHLADASQWVPMRIHQMGQRIAQASGGNSRVLTFAPIIPLEGGLKIYPELVTGPFAARAAEQLSEADEDAFHVFDCDDCLSRLSGKSPPCVLTGYENDMDERLHEGAAAHAFTRTEFDCLGKELSLDVPPPAAAAQVTLWHAGARTGEIAPP